MLNNLSIEFSVLLAALTPALPEEFIVKVNDRGPLYSKELIKLIEKYRQVNGSATKYVKFGNYVIFEKSGVSVETDANEAADLRLPIYKLADRYDTVVKLVNNFFQNVYKPKTTGCPFAGTMVCAACPFSNYKTKKKEPTIIRDGHFVNVEEKVSIMYNFVKIGYDQYDIIEDWLTGTRLVEIEGNIFKVKSDYKGKYLELVK